MLQFFPSGGMQAPHSLIPSPLTWFIAFCFPPLLLTGHWHITGEQALALPLKKLMDRWGSHSGLSWAPRNLVGVAHCQHQASEVEEAGGARRLLRHLEDRQGPRVRVFLATERHCLGRGGECERLVRCSCAAGARVPRRVVWEQVRLERKWGPDPTWLCRPQEELDFMQR